MTRTYKATGINLKGMPLGEADRLLTILTPEYGLVRAVAPGARKYKSQLRGKSELFQVNQLLIAKGQTLDKITQADTIRSYPGLSRDLGKLASGQYLAELVLGLALREIPQRELYELLNEHLRRLDNLSESTIPYLAQAVFHLLAIAGVAPQVKACCLSKKSRQPNFSQPNWEIGFSFHGGGVVARELMKEGKINARLGAVELALLQQLGEKSLPQPQREDINGAWIKVERVLRYYAQYQIGHPIRSAALIHNLNDLRKST